MMMKQTMLVLDFGGQYKELIARNIRECGVYSIIKDGDISIDEIKEIKPIGIILTGGPNSVLDEKSPKCQNGIFDLGIPVLGICYGMQVIAYMLGGKIESGNCKEYGVANAKINTESKLFNGLKDTEKVLMSHTDFVVNLPKEYTSIAFTDNCKNAAFENANKNIYGLQFHPEVELTQNGTKIIKNFALNICGGIGEYSVDDFIIQQVTNIREQVKNDKVLLALSGGVDSSVCAALLSHAIPDKLVCVFVDHGCMRKNEGDEVEKAFNDKNLKFIRVNAEERFLNALKGITSPEQKRKIIGKEFVDIFEEEANKLGKFKYLAQGTIYPDIVESGTKFSSKIKSHHNVGGLPKRMNLKVLEPLKDIFKDEVRKIGLKLNLPSQLVFRQPFPGPGLAVRVIGEITKEKLDILRDADYIFRYEMEKAEIKSHQYFAILTSIKSVGVMGDSRTYEYTVALRAINTKDFMTASFTEIPYEILKKVSTRIVNEVKGVNRIVYDITSKPPATIEWE